MHRPVELEVVQAVQVVREGLEVSVDSPQWIRMAELKMRTQMNLSNFLRLNTCCTLAFLIAGCGDGSYSDPTLEPSETASATFSIKWHDSPENPMQSSRNSQGAETS